MGGQQLVCSCMFCNRSITSTGASRVVEHFADGCVLCAKEVKEACQRLRSNTLSKRKAKEEHKALVVKEQEHGVWPF